MENKNMPCDIMFTDLGGGGFRKIFFPHQALFEYKQKEERDSK